MMREKRLMRCIRPIEGCIWFDNDDDDDETSQNCLYRLHTLDTLLFILNSTSFNKIKFYFENKLSEMISIPKLILKVECKCWLFLKMKLNGIIEVRRLKLICLIR